MTDNTQPEALRLAQELDEVPETGGDPDSIQECAAELRRQHTRIAELEAQLESIGAGGVNGPLMGQPQAMPDLSQLKERGAKAWAGVDARGLRAGRWYMVNKDGMATLCADEADAQREAADAQAIWPGMGPHSAVQLVDAGRASMQFPGFTAADMATPSAQGFRDGVASLSANAEEPRNAIDREALIDAIAQGLHGTWHCARVWEAWHVGTMSQDDFEPVDESETPTEIADAVLALLAAPPTAQAEGWIRVDERLPEPDGPVLAHNGKWTGVAAWMSGEYLEPLERWQDEHREFIEMMGPAITHWMPLPPPPTSAEGVEP